MNAGTQRGMDSGEYRGQQHAKFNAALMVVAKTCESWALSLGLQNKMPRYYATREFI